MKRKGSEYKNNPMYGAKKSKSVYFGDPSLIPRIREYLADNKSKKNISISVMASDLQRKYGEYARKKRNTFTKTVEKAYSVICAEEEEEEDEEVDELSALEAKHLKQKQACTANSSYTSDEEKSFSSENPEYVQYEDTNTMNSMMSTLYKKTPQKADSGTEGGTSKHKLLDLSSVPEKSSLSGETVSFNSIPPKQSGEMRSSDVSFFIDRGGDRGILNKGNIASQYSPNTPPAEKYLGHKYPKRDNCDKSQPQNSNQNRKKLDEDLELDISNTFDKDKSEKVEKEQVSDRRLRKKSKRDGDKSSAKPEKKSVQAQKSTVTFADFGGNEVGLKEVCKLLVHLRHPEVYSQLGVTPPRGFLLHGPPGCGKTLLAHAIAGELDLPFLKVAGPELVSGVSGESEEKIRELFEKALACAPCIVFIDEIDAITPKRETASKDMERRIVAQLLTCMDDLSTSASAHVLVIGATNRPDSLDPALRRAGRFDREISLGIPDESARLRILKVLCRNLRLEAEFDFMYLAKNTPGFVGADLMALAREAAMTAVNRVFNELKTNLKNSGPEAVQVRACSEEQSPMSIEKVSKDDREPSEKKTKLNQDEFELESVLTWLKEQPPLTDDQLKDLFILLEDFKEALKHVQPSAKREGFATIPDVTWDDVGALHNVREELQLAILAPVRHREEFESLGIQRAQGILLAGPPGCGKTLLAKAVANESGINFISVKGPELLNMYVGESERAVRQVFQRARNSAPCVIFFDELDALCPRRSDAGEGGSSVRVVNQLLTEMDGLEERKQVFIMAATNRPDIIDPAILRPGRLDKTLYVGLPSAEDRLDILKTITKNGTKPQLDGVELAVIANDERCKGYTGADIAALVREASVLALKEVISPGSLESLKVGVCVRNQHFDAAFSRIKPSVSEKDQQKYLKMQL
ncbi:hypothetical protein CHS0354_036021 [Potamilus streckersoni]|uniref:AAA+ ATPase domain-containing protein n=1 Tax=Potamilus streckersoni TaxID=2493646 RepID=A0AAE0VFW1_9BIVA|nr:hypothetical protein CHS0354_036021 [Potamilus streckersoni]